MTDSELRIAIAERKGWTRVKDMHDFGSDGPWGNDPSGNYSAAPDYPGDPREWAELLEEMRDSGIAIERIGEDWVADHIGVGQFEDPELGRSVCLAWLAWHAARSGEGE